jgi:drug/metabolite transporter (DMT)-like permease
MLLSRTFDLNFKSKISLSTGTNHTDQQNPLAGIGWMLLTGILFVSVTGIVRHLGSALPAIEMAFIRYAFGILLVAPTLLMLIQIPPSLKLVQFFAIRGFLHASGVCLWFYAMARIPIAEVTAIGYVAPIFVTVGAALFLGEKLHARRIISVIVGFLGALIILRPGFQEINSGQLAQLCAAPIFAASFLMAKRMTDNQDTVVIVAMLTVFCTVALMPGALYYWQSPTPHEIGWLFFAALSATCGHYTLTRAFKAAPITVTQPLSFLQLVWATLLGVTLFNETVNIYVILGGGLVVASVTYISHREAKTARLNSKRQKYE